MQRELGDEGLPGPLGTRLAADLVPPQAEAALAAGGRLEVGAEPRRHAGCRAGASGRQGGRRRGGARLDGWTRVAGQEAPPRRCLSEVQIYVLLLSLFPCLVLTLTHSLIHNFFARLFPHTHLPIH